MNDQMLHLIFRLHQEKGKCTEITVEDILMDIGVYGPLKTIDTMAERADFYCTHLSMIPDTPPPAKDAIIDEEMSVRWNREEVARRREQFANYRTIHRNAWDAISKLTDDKLVKLMGESLYETGMYASKRRNIPVVNDEWAETAPRIARLAWDAAYDEAHADGYSAVLNKADEYLMFYRRAVLIDE